LPHLSKHPFRDPFGHFESKLFLQRHRVVQRLGLGVIEHRLTSLLSQQPKQTAAVSVDFNRLLVFVHALERLRELRAVAFRTHHLENKLWLFIIIIIEIYCICVTSVHKMSPV
jgi:hypothetical protein